MARGSVQLPVRGHLEKFRGLTSTYCVGSAGGRVVESKSRGVV